MSSAILSANKQKLRQKLREDRRAHVAALPDAVRALVFNRPPRAALDLVPAGATVGLYNAVGVEAPTLGYAKWFHENGHRLALPWFDSRETEMAFRLWSDPYNETELIDGPFSHAQPASDANMVVPDVLFVPLIGFTANGERLGQGGGHYDRWLEANPGVTTIGLAWDCQLVDSVPLESHDRRLAMIVTPTRAYAGGQ